MEPLTKDASDIPRRGRGNWSQQITDDEYRAKLKAKCEVDASGCWVYQGWCHKPPREYGYMGYRGKQWRTHQLSYFLHKGPISQGKVVCHSCDNQKCCNPDHLWLGTQYENLMDCIKKGRHANAAKTLCKRGHPLSGDNVRVNSFGTRVCLTCVRARQRIRSGWPAEEAYGPAIPQNAKTERRWNGKRKAA